MVTARAMLINKHLILMLALLVGASINVSAQEQNNTLINVLDRMKQLQDEVTELRNQNELTQYELKSFQKNINTQLTKLKMQIDASSTETTASIEPEQTTTADSQLKELKDNFQKLNRKINQINNRLNELTGIIEKLQPPPPQESEVLVEEPEQTPPLQPEETAPEPEQPKAKIIPIKPAELPNQNEYAAYSRAMGALERADYTRLRDNLTRFLQDYPDGDYADDASYWIAEAYYAEQNLESAEFYFTQLIENYKDSEKREDALLKIAYIRLSNKQWEAARNVLELLENKAEDEQIRKLASEQLKQLESKGH